MLKEIEQLLLLQDRDQKIKMFTAELETVPLEGDRIDQLLAAKQSAFEQLKQRSRELEVRRKSLELDAQSRRDSIAKYKTQQFQTRKNEEFQAIGQEINRFEKEIEQIEDNEIEIMELSERIQSELGHSEQELNAAKRQSEQQQRGFEQEAVDFGRAIARGASRTRTIDAGPRSGSPVSVHASLRDQRRECCRPGRARVLHGLPYEEHVGVGPSGKTRSRHRPL